MKKTIIVVLISVLFIPISIFAKPQALDLEGTLKDEGISIAFDNYVETEEQVIIYLFRGAGCIHCHDFLEFLNEFAKDNGTLFKLRSYEVYKNEDNNNLKKKIAEHFGDRAGGVPYIIIGNNTFYGFAKESAPEIENTIKEEYKKTDRYDAFLELDKSTKPVISTGDNVPTESPKKKSNAITIIILIIAIFFSILIIFTDFVFRKKKSTKSK